MDWTSLIGPVVVAAIVSGLVALASLALTVVVAERKLRRDFQLEFAAERVVKEMLRDSKWRLRSFEIIKHHLGGFGDDDLRRILVRAGAIAGERAQLRFLEFFTATSSKLKCARFRLDRIFLALA